MKNFSATAICMDKHVFISAKRGEWIKWQRCSDTCEKGFIVENIKKTATIAQSIMMTEIIGAVS